MTRRCGFGRPLGRGVRGLALAGLLIFGGALAGMPAEAFEPPPGSKNFTPPGSVPNYFSNEAAPFGRGAAVAQPGADRFYRAPIAPPEAQAATPQPTRDAVASAGRATHRGRLARGGSGRFKYVVSRTARGHAHSAHLSTTHRRWARGGPAQTHLAAKPASRHSVASKHRASAARPRHATRRAGHIRQASR